MLTKSLLLLVCMSTANGFINTQTHTIKSSFTFIYANAPYKSNGGGRMKMNAKGDFLENTDRAYSIPLCDLKYQECFTLLGCLLTPYLFLENFERPHIFTEMLGQNIGLNFKPGAIQT